MIALAESLTTSALPGLAERIGRAHFPTHGLRVQGDAVIAQYFRSQLTSAFQPLVRADGATEGHHGLLRVHGDAGVDAAAPWGLFAQASGDASLVKLDRLSRTVHALNYFVGSLSPGTLFLNVERRLLASVTAEHGAYFEAILRLFEVAPERVVIVLPRGASAHPAAYVRAALSYRIRGYRLMAPLASPDPVELQHVLLADPHYVAVDVPADPRTAALAPRVREALQRRGIATVARRIETVEQAGAAREAGFRLLQGWLFGEPRPAP